MRRHKLRAMSRKRWAPSNRDEAAHTDLCQRLDCIASRAALDTARVERDAKVAELQQLRSQLLELATHAAGGDAGLSVGARTIQNALMEILDDAMDEEDEGEEGG